MSSGEWIVVVEGLTFAWMRSFSINAGPQVTTYSTPTVTFTVTEVPSTTVSAMATSIYLTTLPPSTVTVLASVVTKMATTTPAKVTVISTSTSTRIRTTRLFTKTISTKTLTTSCKTQPPKRDPTCTIRPTKATLKALDIEVDVKIGRRVPDRFKHSKARHRRDSSGEDVLFKRDAGKNSIHTHTSRY